MPKWRGGAGPTRWGWIQQSGAVIEKELEGQGLVAPALLRPVRSATHTYGVCARWEQSVAMEWGLCSGSGGSGGNCRRTPYRPRYPTPSALLPLYAAIRIPPNE